MIAVPTRVRELSKQLSATKDSDVARDVALLGARIVLAWIFIYHGAYTLFGAFGGSGLHSASIFFATVAHLHPGGFFAVVAGVTELVGGAAVGVGIFGRIAAVGLVVVMVMAMVTVTFSNGISSVAPGGGYELNLALAALALVVAILGTGRYSLDVALRTYASKPSAPKVEA
ncbi:MAG TPA: DoxX family protein [Acidimicrobiales bacterium]|jgi:putative oxidoreductase